MVSFLKNIEQLRLLMATLKDVEKLLKELEEKGKIVNVGHLDYSLLDSSLLEEYPSRADKSEYYLALSGFNLFMDMGKVLAIAQELFKDLPSIEIENMDHDYHHDRSPWQYIRIYTKELIGELSKKTVVILNPEQNPRYGFTDRKKEEKSEAKLYRQIYLYLYPKTSKAHYAYNQEIERRHSPSF